MYLKIIAILVIITIYYIRHRKSKFKLPNGPLGLPLFGNIPQLISKNPYKKLSKWADKYGKIYSIIIGTKPAIVINDPKLMQEIFSTIQSTGKYQTETFLRVSQGPYGIINTDGETWSEQRTFCIKKLKEFGFGNNRMEALIQSEANEIHKWIKTNNQNNNSVVSIKPIFVQAIVNNIWTLVSGSRITLGDTEIVRLMNQFTDTLQYTTKTGLVFLPRLKHIAPGISGYTAYDKACVDLHNYVKKEFEEHKRTFISSVERDLIDAYIEHAGDDPLKWRNAVAAVVELFLAASEATASTLTWMLFYLCQNPKLQKKLQKEIDSVIEGDAPTVDHKQSMPFTEAVILETLRISTHAPIGTIHLLLDDLNIRHYKFPKDLILIPNIYHCHYNQCVWGDPEAFRPERFLEQDGLKLKTHIASFLRGKRQCLGEHLAMDILFIFATKIFQHFDVQPDASVKPEEYFKPNVGFALLAPALGVYFKDRNKENRI